jgi:hypothetical protein
MFTALAGPTWCLPRASAQAAETTPPTKPAIPISFEELKVEPASLTLSGPRDGWRYVVRGRAADGAWYDLTRVAKTTLAGDCVKLVDGFLEPVKDGEATLTLTAGDKSVALPVKVTGMDRASPVSFVRDVMPILSKTGCNQGTCHGAQKGRNGFKLSLRGYDPAWDHEQIVDDIAGRRVDRKEPANSLFLLKPTQGVAHEGKLLFDERSRYYDILHQWIAEGCVNDTATARRVERIDVFPYGPVLSNIGLEQQLVVVATFPDGTKRDVTREAVYTSSSDPVLTVSPTGMVTALRKGEAAVLIRYEGQFAVNPVSVLVAQPNFKWTDPPAFNYIDELVYEKLKTIQVMPSELCSDADFLRRVYLDLIGVPPTPDEVRAFLADNRETKVKRSEVIDKLLDRNEYVDFWTLRWADLMQVNRKYLGEKGTWAFRNWIHQQVAKDRPWNEMAYDLITGSGDTNHSPASAFFRVARDPEQAVENMTHLFLAIRFNCNKCHDHPFERWTWNQYYHLAAYFGQTAVKKGAADEDEIVFDRRSGGEVKHPRTNAVMEPRFPFSVPGVDPNGSGTRREQLARWVTSKDNPYFAKSMANRLWGYLLGKGIIDPLDDIRAGNPPSNAKLLDALTADFVKHDFRIKHLLRTICNSRTYQLSIVPNATNADDKENFAKAIPRRLTAEQLVDSLRVATGTKNSFDGVPVGFRASQLPDPASGKGTLLDQFGRPVRESPCECERRNEMSLGQAMALLNGPTINDAIADPNGRVARLFKDPNAVDDRKVVEELFLAALGRPPSEKEMTIGLGALGKFPNKKEGAEDLLSQLVNSSAFLFNR